MDKSPTRRINSDGISLVDVKATSVAASVDPFTFVASFMGKDDADEIVTVGVRLNGRQVATFMEQLCAAVIAEFSSKEQSQ